MENWDEIRTAFHVARLGTVSAAAEELGVHHATVIRHVDALESRMGVKLFQRHARGYTATEAGRDLMVVAQTTHDQFGQLASRIKGRGEEVTGELVVTSVTPLASVLSPILVEFQAEHPELTVRYLTDERVFRLEYGEAHVAIRAGRIPQEPDNVVQPFLRLDFALYGHQSYLATVPEPDPAAGFPGQRFVALDDANSRVGFQRWIEANIPPDQVSFRTSTIHSIEEAVISGAGLGFLPTWRAERYPELRRIAPPDPALSAECWLVTHVDLHRTAKVQTFVTYLKQRAREWADAH
ncbi:LysR family transcriptional regulator [Brevirhabdus sp.]|uniref:LysR family transcriptional regulator n=1 Tax=Brevirhabdus sp. TaxID=2004514 RepID=UPI0040594FF8